ncbi:amidohydrolase family protein [Jiella marina]|uniref:amidohydrolase family protein n=1 Tax=Jiella sp. LLJ827 TaxID=2917712 RepID=UPI00210128A1|nr:amidohydrolase family protein [Jiella sp. LLJ827]MCQ0986318.1 amidohydrolase family protein [Jiella sp. LLJ827]
MTTTLIEAAYILEGFRGDEPILHRDAALVVVDGKVAEIGDKASLEIRYPDAKRIGNGRTAVVPGFVNAHHHVGLTPLQLGSLDHSLELWFATRLGLRSVDLYLDTLYSAFEMIASGVTTVQHLHSRAPGGYDGLMAASRSVLGAYRDIGMRASFSMAFRDQNRLVYEDDQAFLKRLPEDVRPALAEYFAEFGNTLDEQAAVFETLFEECRDENRLAVQLGPSNLHWLSDRALARAADLSERYQAPMHVHVLETAYQKEYAHKRAGASAVRVLADHGLLNERLTVGHGVWVTSADIEACAEAGVCLCHNCSSNFRLKSGIAPVNRFVEKGVRVAIGIDEAGINDDRDMLQEMRMVLRAHREPGIDAPSPTSANVLRMATEHGAATTPFGESIGRLTPGSNADLVLFDWDAVTYPYQSLDIAFEEVLVQRAKATSVRTVMIAGEIVYENGGFTKVDRDAVLAEIAAQLARPDTGKDQARKALSAAVLPHVKAFYRDNYRLPPRSPHYKMNDQG